MKPGCRIILAGTLAVFLSAIGGQRICRAQYAAMAGPTPDAPSTATLDRVNQALQLALLAARNDMHELSLRAVRQSLAAGPPIQPMAFQRGRVAVPRPTSSNQSSPHETAMQEIEEQIAALHQIWQKKAPPPEEVYDVLVSVVLPDSRPAEVFLYPRPFNPQDNSGPVKYSGGQPAKNFQPRSVCKFLANWARRAKMSEDLRQRLQQRRGQPRAGLPAEIMLTQLALVEGKVQEVNSRLATLEKLLAQNTLEHSAELACHVAIPALKKDKMMAAALPLVERACSNFVAGGLSRQGKVEPTSTMLVMAARAAFKIGDQASGKRLLNTYLDFHQENNNRYSGDSSLSRRKEQLQVVADELIKADQLAEALKALGEYADIRFSRSSLEASGTFTLRLARGLARLAPDQRYTVLRDWCMPVKGRNSIRSVMAVEPGVRPPGVFGQLTGEKQPLFRIPTCSVTPDTFSTLGMLVDTANELGVLDAFTDELKTLAGQKVENAQCAWILAEITRGNSDAIISTVTQLAGEMAKNVPSLGDYSKPLVIENYLAASACIGQPGLDELAESMLQSMVEHSKSVRNGYIRPVLRRGLARAVIARHGADKGLLKTPDLGNWKQASHNTAKSRYSGPLAPLWIAHEGHMRHVSGDDQDYLFYQYPLTGQFELTLEALDDGWAEGSASCAGLVYEFGGYSTSGAVWGVGRSGRISRPCKYLHRTEFNRLTFSVSPDSVCFRINDIPIHEDKYPIAGCPWIALFSTGERNPIYRNLRIKGNPVIPREVRLIEDPAMRGWVANFYAERRPVATDEPPANPDAAKLEWYLRDKVLHGPRRPWAAPQPPESLLYYQRPLFDGESLSYEFFHKPGEFEAHPALARIAFLIREDGVRLHWITGRDSEWTGLPMDNQVTEPENQRGPNPLPLEANAWNKMVVSLEGNTAVLELNGVEVYRRPLEEDNNRLFGLFHDRIASALKVRNVVLWGDWPEKLSEVQLAKLNPAPMPDATAADGHSFSAIMEERFVSTNAYSVYRQSLEMPPEERYEYLSAWVLPNRDHAEFRLQADFTPTHPAPPVDLFPVDANRSAARLAAEGARQVAVGGNMVAPAIELVSAAKQLERLEELRQQMEQIQADEENRDLDRLSLLTMIHLAQGQLDQVDRLLQEISSKAKTVADAPVHQRWGPTIAAGAAIEYPKTRPSALKILDYFVTELIEKGNEGHYTWAIRNRHLRGLARQMISNDLTQADYGTPPNLTHWQPVVHPQFQSRGRGNPRQHWSLSTSGEVLHTPGHAQDYMYYGIPLRGDFQVECELTSFGYREAYMAYAGFWAGLDTNLDKYGISYFERSRREVTLDPPIESVAPWYRYRIVVRDNQFTSYVDDRKLHEQRLPSERDPWLLVRTFRAYQAGFRNLRVTGNPTVPEQLDLSARPDLDGWINTYYGQTAEGDNPDWRKDGEEIVGRRKNELTGQASQGLLYYHRPMLEDGWIEYEFLYRPGKVITHTALDRLAFMLTPDGVKIHWLTDSHRDRTGLLPDNLLDEPENRRGPAKLPLEENTWNRLRLELKGDTVSLSLNGQQVYERLLEPTNMRNFGLFHYAGRTEARVRNVIYKGDWPAELPPLKEQQLGIDPAGS